MAALGTGEYGADLPVLKASATVIRMAQNRPFFAAALTGSVALHMLALFALNILERDSSVRPGVLEIPVELVSDPSPADKKQGNAAAKPASPGPLGGEVKGGAAAEQASKSDSPKARPPGEKPSARKEANQPKPMAKGEPPKAAAPAQKRAEEARQAKPAKPLAAQPAPAKPAVAQAPPSKPPQPQPQTSQSPPNPPPQPAQQTAKAQAPPVAAPTMAALQPRTAHLAPASPYGVDDPWRAVAVPVPSATGDEAMSYKTIVFGMLEVAKQFPADARARGAHGTAEIYFELDEQGHVKTVKLLQSSADLELDVESLAVVERAAPFPKPPPGAQRIFAAQIEFDPNAR